MSEDQADELRNILKYGVLTPGERDDIEFRLDQDLEADDDFQKILCDHRYALESARRSSK